MRQTRKTAMLAVAVMLGALGCDSSVDIRGPILPTVPPAPGSAGPMAVESRPIAGVIGVQLDAVGLVEIDLTGMEALTITAPESVMPLLTADVVAGRLILDRTSGSYRGQVSDIRYDMTLRQLGEILHHGVGEIRARGIDAGRFVVYLSGVGDTRTSGRADRQEVTVSGVGNYWGADLESRVAQVDIRSGKAQIWATERIEGFVGFGCVLEYAGNPTLEIHGGGTVIQLPVTR